MNVHSLAQRRVVRMIGDVARAVNAQTDDVAVIIATAYVKGWIDHAKGHKVLKDIMLNILKQEA